jgi:hypothetical protein
MYTSIVMSSADSRSAAIFCTYTRASCSGSGDVDTATIAKANTAKDSSSSSSTVTGATTTDATAAESTATDTAVTELTVTGLTVTGLTGRTLQLNPAWENASGEWRLGIKRAYELYPKDLRSRVQAKRAKAFDEVCSMIALTAVSSGNSMRILDTGL